MIIRKFTQNDGIKVFDEDIIEDHSDYSADGLDKLYSAEEKHFWFIARKEFLLGRFNKYIVKQSKIIEIGAGTGNVTRYLSYNGYKDSCVGEMHRNGLEYARRYGIKGLYQFNLMKTPFENEFDVVGLFDVLEHIEDDDLALDNIRRMLKKEGKIIITVPSHEWLWNRDDRIAHHKRRYIKKNMKEKLERNSFDIVEMRYFFITITPLLLLRRILNYDRREELHAKVNEGITINPVINSILLCLCRLENRFFKFIPNFFGGSLFVIAEKAS